MIRKPNNWEQVEAVEYGEREMLELGGHVVVIRNAAEYTGQTGNSSLKVCVDIAPGDKQAGFFQKQFDDNPNSDKKWSNGATKYVSLKEEHAGMLKAFTTAVEKSNPGYTWNWDETSLKGKKLVGVFGLEEYEKQDGTIGTATRLVQFRSIDKLNEVKIPKVRLLNGSTMDHEEYKNSRSNQSQTIEYTGDSIDGFLNSLPINADDAFPF